jgi:hypothetical protein
MNETPLSGTRWDRVGRALPNPLFRTKPLDAARLGVVDSKPSVWVCFPVGVDLRISTDLAACLCAGPLASERDSPDRCTQDDRRWPVATVAVRVPTDTPGRSHRSQGKREVYQSCVRWFWAFRASPFSGWCLSTDRPSVTAGPTAHPLTAFSSRGFDALHVLSTAHPAPKGRRLFRGLRRA